MHAELTRVSRERLDPTRDSAFGFGGEEDLAAGRRGKSVNVWRLLDAAAEQCIPALREDGTISGSANDIASHVALITNAIGQASRGSIPNLGSLPSHVPARRVLDALRAAFLDQANGSRKTVDGQELLTVLRAMECVQRAFEKDAAQRLATRLSGPDAVELVVAVAHDMRSPLTSILFLMDALRSGHSGPLTPQQERQLLIVYSAAFGLSALASDLLDLARGGDRLVDVSEVPFSVRECMTSAIDIVRPMAEEKKLSVDVVAPEVDLRMGHPIALSRVLLNLTTNALKFTESGGIRLTAREVSRNRVEFTVQDTGRGIPPEIIETIFDAFRRRGRDAQFIFSSAGLGLSMCHKLISAMGGELTVRNVDTGGTCFSFQLELPVAQRI